MRHQRHRFASFKNWFNADLWCRTHITSRRSKAPLKTTMTLTVKSFWVQVSWPFLRLKLNCRPLLLHQVTTSGYWQTNYHKLFHHRKAIEFSRFKNCVEFNEIFLYVYGIKWSIGNCKLLVIRKQKVTRMHSSRMCTARFSTVHALVASKC